MEVSKIAGQANAAVLGRHGDTAVLATVVMSDQDKSGDFFPLTVDYEERFYAAGKILGSRFVRREGRATDDAVLSARVIDRTIRPLFDPRLRREVQVVITILSYEEKNDPDFIALLSASAALAISDVPWNGPVAGLKIISPENGNAPGYQAYFAGTDKKINMIEFEGKEIPESTTEKVFAECFEKEIKKLIAFQKDIVKEIGKPKAQVALAEADRNPVGRQRIPKRRLGRSSHGQAYRRAAEKDSGTFRKSRRGRERTELRRGFLRRRGG